MNKRWLSTLIMSLLSLNAISQVYLESGDGQRINVSAQMEILEDANDELSISTLPEQGFVLNGNDDFFFPFTNSAFWIKLQVVNTSSENKDWVIQWDNPTVENLTFFEAPGQSSQPIEQQHFNFAQQGEFSFYSQVPYFTFELAAGDSTTLYFRMKTRRGHYGFLNIYSANRYITWDTKEHRIQSFINGLLFFRLILIAIFSFWIIKDKVFRGYSALLLAKTIGFWSLGNVTGPMLSSNTEAVASIDSFLYSIMPMWLLLFVLRILPMHKVASWIRFAGYSLFFVSMSVLLVNLVDYQWYWTKAGLWMSLLCASYIFITYGYFALKKLEVQKYYLIPLLLGLVSNSLIIFRVLTTLSFNGIFALAFLMFVAEIFVFIIFLGAIVRQTERKKYETEINLLKELDQNRRLQELDELKTSFFTDVSHELRTPLTLMHGPAIELQNDQPGNRLIKLMVDNLTKLRSLVDELLDIQKLEAQKMKPTIVRGDVSGYLRMLVESFSSLAESKKVNLQLVQHQKSFMGCYDEQMLLKIVNNLMSNALKFTPSEGSVRVDVAINENPARLNFSVTNSGEEIEEGQLSRIFDRFYKGSNGNYEGTGIGLALIKELATVLKGEVSASSSQAEGTCFQVSIPIDEGSWKDYSIGDSQEQRPARKNLISTEATIDIVPPSGAKGKELLLIVEDNDDMREYISILLEDQYRIIEATNGKEGIVLAEKEVPDIIICDAMMPVMDGFQFSKHVKDTVQTSHIPIVMLTAMVSKKSKIESYNQGVDHYLAKPFDVEELRSVLQTLHRNRKKLRELYQKDIVDLKPDAVALVSKEKQFLQLLKQYLEDHYAKSDLTVSDIASFLKISDTQLRRKLKSISGYSTNEFIRKYRLEKAAQMLGVNASSVSEVAYAVGFENLSYFSKVFQAEYGCLPSEYGLEKAGENTD